MRLAAGLGFGLAAATLVGAAQAAVGLPAKALPGALPSSAAGVTRVEYFCSPGFEPSYGGTCVAVPSRAEIELFVDQPIYETQTVRRVVRRHRRHGLRERF